MKELLIKLRDEVNSPIWRNYGICSTATNMFYRHLLSEKEFYKLDEYLQNNLPSEKTGGYCWPPREVEPRIKWLNEQIAKFEGEKKVSFWTKIKGIFMPKK
jgi:hypothetical protein